MLAALDRISAGWAAGCGGTLSRRRRRMSRALVQPMARRGGAAAPPAPGRPGHGPRASRAMPNPTSTTNSGTRRDRTDLARQRADQHERPDDQDADRPCRNRATRDGHRRPAISRRRLTPFVGWAGRTASMGPSPRSCRKNGTHGASLEPAAASKSGTAPTGGAARRPRRVVPRGVRLVPSFDRLQPTTTKETMTMTTPPGYNAVAPQVDLPAMEHEVLAFWRDNDTFSKSLAQTADGPRWTFYEGPPTANGMPGTHHIEARAFKDVFPRFKTMQGFRVDRKAGWDCHGLPVELAVEKELGFSGKPDIEAYGVEAFNERCRASVTRHVDAWTELTDRMGYWVNMDDAYWTMSTDYVQSVWWSLKQIHSKGLLVEDYRVAPYCPRCGTTLSDHELAQGYEDVTDPSVYVRFPLTSGPLAGQGGPAGLDDHPLDAGLQHGRRRAPRRHLRGRLEGRRHPRHRRAARREGAGRGLEARPVVLRQGDGGLALPASVRPGRVPRRRRRHALRGQRRLRHHRGRHRPRAPGARLRRGRHDHLPRLRAADGEPDPPRRHLRARSAAGRRAVLQDRRQGARRRPAPSAG